MIQLLNDSLAELKPKNEPPAPKRAPSPPPPEPKWSRENHPAFKKAAPPPEEKEKEPEIITYQVNDNVMAKWVTGDKGFYPARITAVTGSSTAPIYTVRFKSYDTVETLRAKDIRPVAQKRKADGPAAAGNTSAVGALSAGPTAGPNTTATPAASNNGIVLSAAADMYPQAQAANNGDGNGDEKPRPKFKKIKATKELEKGKNKWQEFSTKGKFGKAGKKDSMFRTPEGVHGRGEYCVVWTLDIWSSLLTSQQSASPARASRCAKTPPGPATSTSPTKIWTKWTNSVLFPSEKTSPRVGAGRNHAFNVRSNDNGHSVWGRLTPPGWSSGLGRARFTLLSLASPCRR